MTGSGSSIVVRCSGRVGRLEPGTKLTIGRHKTNDIVGNDAKISRFHATIHWPSDAERPRLEDSSSNGTLVDGKNVRQGCVTLEGDETIVVGSVVLELGAADAGSKKTSLTRAGGSISFGRRLGDSGAIQRQLLNYEEERASGVLELTTDAEAYSLTFRLGGLLSVVSSKPGGASGLEALANVVAASGATYSFVANSQAKAVGKPLDVSLKTFLSQGLSDTLDETLSD